MRIFTPFRGRWRDWLGQTSDINKDIKLMLRFAAGDTDAFDALVACHKDAAYRLAFRFLHDASQAEDVAAEAFVRVWRSRESYEPTASFTTWFYRIVVNLCYNRLRRYKTREYQMRASPDEAEQGLATTRDRSTPSAVDELAAREMSQMVHGAVADLPETQRMAVLLSRLEGMSYAETADAMGTTEKAIKSLMARARTTLKEKLAKYL